MKRSDLSVQGSAQVDNPKQVELPVKHLRCSSTSVKDAGDRC